MVLFLKAKTDGGEWDCDNVGPFFNFRTSRNDATE